MFSLIWFELTSFLLPHNTQYDQHKERILGDKQKD
jgi:hypothetical protein